MLTLDPGPSFWAWDVATRLSASGTSRLKVREREEERETGERERTALTSKKLPVHRGEADAIYINMPPMGLGNCIGAELVKADGHRASARGRMGETKGEGRFLIEVES
jgi:hypothetical protein